MCDWVNWDQSFRPRFVCAATASSRGHIYTLHKIKQKVKSVGSFFWTGLLSTITLTHNLFFTSSDCLLKVYNFSVLFLSLGALLSKGNYYIICNINRTHCVFILTPWLWDHAVLLLRILHGTPLTAHPAYVKDESLLGCLDDTFRGTEDNRGRRQKTQSACGFSLERPI